MISPIYQSYIEQRLSARQSLLLSLLVSVLHTLRDVRDFLKNELNDELQLLNLNARVPLMLSHHYGKQMQQRQRGGIVFLASVVSFAGVPAWSHYAATKGHICC